MQITGNHMYFVTIYYSVITIYYLNSNTDILYYAFSY